MSIDDLHAQSSHTTDFAHNHHDAMTISSHTQTCMIFLLVVCFVVFAVVFAQVVAREKEEEERRKNQ